MRRTMLILGLLLLSTLAAVPAANAATDYGLMVSERADRANAVPLEGRSVSGDVHVFTAPDDGVDQVAFHVDDPGRSGSPVRTENTGPFDLAGGSVTVANPFDTTRLADGPHTITATIKRADGATQVVHAGFEVDNHGPQLAVTPGTLSLSTPAGGPAVSRSVSLAGSDATAPRYGAAADAAWLSVSPNAGTAPATLTVRADPAGLAAGTYTGRVAFTSDGHAPATLVVTFTVGAGGGGSGPELRVSASGTRQPSQPLAGATLRGDAHVFLPAATGISQVAFHVDDPNATGTPFRVEKTSPYDLAGGTAELATAWDTTKIAAGAHTVTAVITSSNGSKQRVSASFAVSHALPPDQVHLAWVGEPSTTLTAVWRTRGTTGATQLEYRAVGAPAWTAASGTLRPSGTSGTLREVTLTGLAPGTAYEYRVRGDADLWSPVFRTRTAPRPGPADFEAIYFADTGLVGRADGLAHGTAEVVRRIAEEEPLLTLPGGDYAYYSTDKRYGTLDATIDAWFNQSQPFAATAPMMPTYGNHEVLLGEGYDAWAQRFPTPAGIEGRRFYSFDVGDVHFVSIHAVANYTGLTSAQLAWIEQDIQAARGRGMRWTVPYLHVSPFTDGRNHPSNLELRRQLGPIFERTGVKVVFTSHDQAYERTYPLADIGGTNRPTSTSKSCYGPADGVTFVKVSPAGKHSNISGDFSPFAHSTPPAWTAHRDNTAHFYGRLRVSAAGVLAVDAMAVRGDGSAPEVRDSFEYRLAGCGGQPDTTPPPAPAATPAAGTYSAAQSVRLASEPGATIRYTTNGSTPTTASALYTGPIAVGDDLTIRALAIDAAGNRSGVAAHAYVIGPPPAGTSYSATVARTAGLAGYWRLEEAAGTGAADALGRSPGTYENGVRLGVAGGLASDPGSRAAAFDGVDDQVRVPDAAALDTGDSFTLEAWVRRSATSSSKTYRVLSKGDGAYAFGFAANRLTLRHQSLGDFARSRGTLTDTQGWHHIAATKDGASVRLYLDGVDVTDPASVPSPVPAVADTADDLFIGRASNGSAAFPGAIDEAAVYDRALSAAEVAGHHRAGTG